VSGGFRALRECDGGDFVDEYFLTKSLGCDAERDSRV